MGKNGSISGADALAQKEESWLNNPGGGGMDLIWVDFLQEAVSVVIKSTGPWLKSAKPGFKSWLCHLPAVWPWTDYLASLSCSFLMCEMRKIIPSSKSCWVEEMIMHRKSQQCWAHRTQSVVTGINHLLALSSGFYRH